VTNITFFGGVNEVGGNKILLEDKGTKIFIDFGKSFAQDGRFFEHFLKPTKPYGINIHLRMGLIPNIPGLYRDDLIEFAGRKPVAPDFQGVLISHAHSDHVDYASFLHEKIPLYMGETCKNVLKALDERDFRNFERSILDFDPMDKKRGDPPTPRTIKTFRSGKKFKIDSLEIQPLHVDHSVPGAYGFIIYTSEGPVVYTGDLRRHGTMASMTEEFIAEAKAARPVALLAEGTRIADEPTDENEQKVFDEAYKIISKSKNLVFADFNFKDVDRVRTFYNIAKKTGRKLVVKMRDCPFLEQFHNDPNLNTPNIDDEHIVIYKGRQNSGTFADSDYGGNTRKYANMENALTPLQITKNPGKYLCALGFFSFKGLVDMNPKSGAIYIHSASEPWTEEQEYGVERRDNWIEHFDMVQHQIHCSGHAKGQDLLDMVREIGAKMLYPIHSEHPKEYKKITDKITLVKLGKQYTL
jgi:ribonuclease J